MSQDSDSEAGPVDPPADPPSMPKSTIPGLKPPPHLQSLSPKEWKLWKQQWLNYALLANLTSYTGEYQVALLLHTMGPKYLEIFSSFENQTNDIKAVIKQFEAYAIGETNESYERYIFNQRKQREGEKFEDFLSALRVLAQTCNFCKCLTDSIMRDRIIVGIRNAETRKKLLQERELTLHRCIDICKSAEQTDRQCEAFQGNGAHASDHATSVHGVNRRPPGARPKQNRASSDKPKQHGHKPKFDEKKCLFCGRRHPMVKSKCPAYGKTCRSCGNKNHFREMCKKSAKSKVQIVEPNDPENEVYEYDSNSDDEYHINTVHLEVGKSISLPAQSKPSPKPIQHSAHTATAKPSLPKAKPVMSQSKLNATMDLPDSDMPEVNIVNKPNLSEMIFAIMTIKPGDTRVTFEVDCGARVNILPLQFVPQEYRNSMDRRPYYLKMWNNTKYKALGLCTIKIQNPRNGKMYDVPFIIVRDNFTPLLGNKYSQLLGLITVNTDNFLVASVSAARTEAKPEEQFADVFNGELGQLPGAVHLEIDHTVEPTILPPRRLPHAIKPRVKSELDSMVAKGVISPVQEPTRWVSQLVVAEKRNKELRICIDPRPLNKALKRAHYQLPTIDDILPDLAQAKVFSKLDLSSAFWQICLDEESSKLTTFATPFGRYKWNRLPFGTSVSSEIFQQRIHMVLEGLHGIVCVADDILVYGTGETDADALRNHDQNLSNLLARCSEKCIKLNKQKSIFRVEELPFLGHVVTNKGLKPDPDKIKAIIDMPTPANVADVQRLVGFVNYLSRFLPELSDTLEPLRQLTRQDVEWHWSDTQQQALNKLKQMITNTPVLTYYNPEENLVIQCDASSKGLGTVLLQNDKPIAFASRALSDTETRYATIEKEMLAVVFSFERFHQYTFGRHTKVISDHKPLEMISKKPLCKAPKRLQGMLMKLQNYTYEIIYRPGKTQVIADALSRAFLPISSDHKISYSEVNMVNFLPIRDERLEQIKQETERDDTLQVLKKVIIMGWPENRTKLPEQLTPFFSFRDELAVQDGLIFKADRVVVPRKLRTDMINKIHSSHLGTDGCLRRARECLFWPRMSYDIKQYIQECDICRTYEISQPKETLMSHAIPSRPWERVGTDLFSWQGKDYLITVDYYSNFWEIDFLANTSSQSVVNKLKAHFARYGSPVQLVSDNGPQFTSETFRKFTTTWDIEHLTSSPGNSQANGMAESAVKTAKRLLTKSHKAGSDPYLAMMDHRNTPSQGLQTSPAQRLMNRRTRTLLPTAATLLQPRVIDETDNMKIKKDKQATYFNKTAKDLKPLHEGDVVRMKPLVNGQKTWQKAVVTERLDQRSYLVETPTAMYRRNRVHLRKTAESPPETATSKQSAIPRTMKPAANQETTASFDHKAAATNKSSSNRPTTPVKTTYNPARKTTSSTKEPEQPQPLPQTKLPTTRSGREIKLPVYLKDYEH